MWWWSRLHTIFVSLVYGCSCSFLLFLMRLKTRISRLVVYSVILGVVLDHHYHHLSVMRSHEQKNFFLSSEKKVAVQHMNNCIIITALPPPPPPYKAIFLSWGDLTIFFYSEAKVLLLMHCATSTITITKEIPLTFDTRFFFLLLASFDATMEMKLNWREAQFEWREQLGWSIIIERKK